MPFPPAIPLVTVTGALFGWDSMPRTGRLLFEMTHFVQDSPDMVMLPPCRVNVVLGTTNFVVQGGVVVSGVNSVGPGCFSIVLVATDYSHLVSDQGSAPAYTVVYDLDNDTPFTRYYTLPSTPSVTDISELTEVGGP